MEEQKRAELIEEERKRARRLRLMVDLTMATLSQDPSMTLDEARALVHGARRAALQLFPGKERTFEMLLQPRFERVLYERWGKGLEETIS